MNCALGLTGKALGQSILNETGNLTWILTTALDKHDGAASVSGHINGLSAHILEILESMRKLYTLIVTVTD